MRERITVFPVEGTLYKETIFICELGKDLYFTVSDGLTSFSTKATRIQNLVFIHPEKYQPYTCQQRSHTVSN